MSDNYPAFDPNKALFVGLAQYVAERDGISVDEASKNLGNLFDSPEVQAQHAEEQANSPQAKLVRAREALKALEAELG